MNEFMFGRLSIDCTIPKCHKTKRSLFFYRLPLIVRIAAHYVSASPFVIYISFSKNSFRFPIVWYDKRNNMHKYTTNKYNTEVETFEVQAVHHLTAARSFISLIMMTLFGYNGINGKLNTVFFILLKVIILYFTLSCQTVTFRLLIMRIV